MYHFIPGYFYFWITSLAERLPALLTGTNIAESAVQRATEETLPILLMPDTDSLHKKS